MKIKNILLVLTFAMTILSCGNDNNSDPFDAEAQVIIDDALLIDYLNSHYLIEEDGTVDEIANGEQSLFSKIKTSEITYNDINYKLYYYILKEGEGAKATLFDSVVTDISGIRLDSTYFQYPTLDSRFDLTGLAFRNGGSAGFAYAAALLKAGTKKINEDESFSFENSGEGIFFLPSGLGFGNDSGYNTGIEANSPIIFKIKLNVVKESDNDNDGILNKDEDTNKDGDLSNDDTDGDGIPNYLDKDN